MRYYIHKTPIEVNGELKLLAEKVSAINIVGMMSRLFDFLY
jgi:hypothetical protein